MATQKIRYDIEAAVSGGAEVNALASSLEGLANTLEDDLKTQALASAAALRQLGEKQTAIDTFRRLKTEVEAAAGGLREAQTAAQQLGQKIGASEAPTRAQAGQLQKLRDSVRAAKTELQQKTVALDQSRGALRAYGVGTDNLAQSERNVRAAIEASKAEVRQLVPAYTAAGQAAAASGRQQAQAATEARQGLSGLGEQLRTIQGLAVAALGGSFVGTLVGDVGRTADAYSNLSARIRLATGEGAAFEAAMEGVADVALRTNTSLEGTATLFARLTDAGKNAGLSAAASQAQALSLTETINQAVQVSGASAQASEAALVQLIQGLQSGVLRGEEFNSVMEQSPRLARALADGLGVTTGELRKMANQGQLTTDVVIGALKSQADTLKTEYATLPLTIGRSIQNLSTSWTLYVGEADKATGASRTAATAINALAQNLDTIAGLLIDVGQAAAAFAALRLAQTFLGIGAAATASAVAVGANTAAMGAASVAATGAAASVGQFAGMLAGIKLFALAAVVSNFQNIGVWIGEGIAKLQGYKDKTDELAEADKARAQVAAENLRISEAQTAANRAATEAQFELSAEARGTLATFEGLVKEGKTAAEAVAAIGKDFDLQSAPGIANASAVLDKLVADGRISAEQFRAAWAEALKGEDLAVFETRARAALSGSAREAERLAAILESTLNEAVRRTGLNMAVISGGMGQAATSALNDTDRIVQGLDQLSAKGVDVSQVLEASLSQALNTADGQKAIDEVRARVESLRTVLGNTVTDGLLDQARAKAEALKESLDNAKPGINSLEEAMRRLGITSDASLKQTAATAKAAYDAMAESGIASSRELGEAFKKSAEAAIAANNGIAPSWVAAEAAARGYALEADKAGKTTVRAMGEAAAATATVAQSMNDATAAVSGYAQGVAEAAEQLRKLQALQGLAGAGGDLSGASTESLQKAQTDLLKNGGALSSPEYIKLRNELMSRRAPTTDASGFSLNQSGGRLAMGSELGTLTGIKNFLQQAGLDEAKAKEVALEFSDGRGAIPYFSNPGQLKYGGRTSTISEALLKAAERTTFAPTPPGQPLPPGASGSRTVVVEIRNGNRVDRVNTDEAGAASIAAAFRESALAAGR